MAFTRVVVGAAAVLLAGCAAVVSPPRRDDATVDAPDAPLLDAPLLDAPLLDDAPADGAAAGEDARDASIDAPDVEPACPASPPRPGRCAQAGSRCTYPNGCTYRCTSLIDVGAGYWFTTAWCF